MFGYVTIYRKGLEKPVLDRYQAYYCGLCEQLGTRYGLPGRMTLSYDMTFVALLLSALYDPETRCSAGRCALHPLKARPRMANGYLEYAAELGIALAYYNELDDWQDEHRTAARRRAQKLEPFLEEITARRPVQCEAIRRQLAALNELESAASTDLDALCGCFGELLGAVLQCHEDAWSPVLNRLGRGLGGFIYLMDAYDDLEKDRRRGSFNALAALAGSLPPAEYERQVHTLLTDRMAVCAEAFEILPILKETPEGQLLYNTIYSGVWCHYALTKARHDKRGEGKNKDA